MSAFRGWTEVAWHLREMAHPSSNFASLLNDGQRAALEAIADRIGRNGVIIADEVGMGKTRIAVFVAKAVELSGGRSAVIIPPGLSFQWQREFRDCGTVVSDFVRSMDGYLRRWEKPKDSANDVAKPWFESEIVLVSHRFADWRIWESSSKVGRWALLPELYAEGRRRFNGRRPHGYSLYAEHRSDGDHPSLVLAAAESIVQAMPDDECHPARGLLEQLLKDVSWPRPLEAEAYRRNGPLRIWLEKAFGLGLGVFDFVIIDEAHKNRSETGGLSTVIEKVILASVDCRRLALTATPVELEADQWKSTLARIALPEAECDRVVETATSFVKAIGQLRSGWRHNPAVAATYRDAAHKFQEVLSPYLLRRDKWEDQDVRDFAEASGEYVHDYRDLRDLPVELENLTPAWTQVVCAAEALSLITEPATDNKAKRLRLTIGNGHGLASVIDEAFRDAGEDKKQLADEKARAESEGETVVDKHECDASKNSRTDWWLSTLRAAAGSNSSILFDHPAILAAIHAIEQEVERGEKVLVFGRFTRPMRALVNLLNARQMLRAVEQGRPWSQGKVHQDSQSPEYGEWSAVKAAHRQLSSTIDLATLDQVLEQRYGAESTERARFRDTLLSQLRDGLAGLQDRAKCLAILEAMERQGTSQSGEGEEERHMGLLARALRANVDGDRPSNRDLALAFRALVDAAADRDSGDDEEFDEDVAAEAWIALEQYLGEGYPSRQGSFARLMYGETKPQTRRMIQLAFNRPNSFPRVLVAQSLVGREGLNLHESCRIVVLLHPEWNPGVVEQQIGRVDRVNSRWAKELRHAIAAGKHGKDLPRIEVRPIVFKGTYDEHNWNVLRDRWDDLRAQLHGEAIPTRLRRDEDAEGQAILDRIAEAKPSFSPLMARRS